jgi:hypothetical protein
MLTEVQKNQFDRDGYLVVPSVLSLAQIKGLREFLAPKFARPKEERFPGDTDNILFDLVNRYVETRWLLFHPQVVDTLRSLLGDSYAVIRETSAHHEIFSSWHKDTGAQEAEGHRFQWRQDYLMVEAGFYLQDNTDQYGGGLDVVPGAHRIPDPVTKSPAIGYKPEERTFVQKIAGRVRSAMKKVWGESTAKEEQKEESLPGCVSVPTKAGDLLIFDFRINHRATPRRVPKPSNIPEKMAIFFACSRNNEHVRAYHDFIASRKDYIYLQNFSYDEDFKRQAKEAGIVLA